MTKYIAFLRGINVGGNNKVEMPKLKKIFESLGFSNVSTYINTGNIIFETANKDTTTLTEEIEKSLKKSFGFEIRVVIRDSVNIQKLCKEIPSTWNNDAAQKTDVLFLWNDFANKNTLDLIATTKDVDTLIYITGAIVWNVQKSSYTKSSMKKFIGTKVYKNMTARNINTVRKLGEMVRK
jgi:uncharacterized protein (DUF1697 family)